MGFLVLAVAGTILIAAYAALENDGPTEAPVSAMQASEELPPAPPSPLTSDRTLHEFGDVGIGDGVVDAEFVVTNAGSEPARVIAVYTSCMCTTATLSFPDGTTEGPFGMPGHELPITMDRELEPSEAVTVSVQFDPAAHGPEGIGPVERTVTFHTENGSSMSVVLTANVVSE